MAITVDVPQSSFGLGIPSGTGTTIAVTTTSAVASGALIVVFVYFWNASNVLSSVSGGGLTWTVDMGTSGSVGNQTPQIASAFAPSGLASSTTITATLSSTCDARTITGFSILGVDTTDKIGNTSPPLHNGSGVTPWTTSSVTVEDGSMLVGYAGTENTGPTSTPDDVEIGEWLGPYDEPQTAGYQIASGAGALTVSGTWSTNVHCATCAVEYRMAEEAPPWDPEVDSPAVLRTVASPLRAR